MDNLRINFDGGQLHTGTGAQGWWHQHGCLIRERDNAAMKAYADDGLWLTQIIDYERREAAHPTSIRPPVGHLAAPVNDGTTPLQSGERIRLPDSYTVIKRGERVVEAMAAIQEPVPVTNEARDPTEDERVEGMRKALLHIIGDLPMPTEDPWERCRRIAAGALGYDVPDPLPRPTSPVVREPIYDGGPDHLAALARDRDAWSAQCAALVTERDKLLRHVEQADDLRIDLARERDAVRAQMATFVRRGVSMPPTGDFDAHLIWWPDELPIPYFEGEQGQRQTREVLLLQGQIATRDATIADLNSQLAAFKASNVTPVPDPPKLVHNPFKHREREPWRMGPEGIE